MAFRLYSAKPLSVTNAGILLIKPLENKLQWNFSLNLIIFIQENAFENVIRKLAAILSQPQCVNK